MGVRALMYQVTDMLDRLSHVPLLSLNSTESVTYSPGLAMFMGIYTQFMGGSGGMGECECGVIPHPNSGRDNQHPNKSLIYSSCTKNNQ